uniref:Ubiq_cyt_C_chap domain-containing protein n=1 Tax=Rhabditophanes sp. KR3021 TaxID=114890 RepID=A0AC35TUU0_9BILA
MNQIARTGIQLNRRFCLSAIHHNVPAKKEYRPLTVDEYVAQEIAKKPPLLPMPFYRVFNAAKSFFVKKNVLDPEMSSLLDKSASQLYFNCANNFAFLTLQDNFGLPDTMASWYKLSLLHVWMVLMRMHTSMDIDAYERLRTGVLSAMWMDIDKRLDVISKELNEKMTSKSDIKHMHALYLQTLFEYDEAFLKSDAELAGAVWRNLYLSREFDPICMNNVVKYMRSTVAYLETIKTADLLVDGVGVWKHLESPLALK